VYTRTWSQRVGFERSSQKPDRRARNTLSEDPTGKGTSVTFNWYVRVTNPALNLLGYVAERVYRHSHDSVMKEGESGLRAYCERKIRPQEA
jgi:hypothetical protein